MRPSDTPPVRRVSSAISTRPVARASRSTSAAGSGASQRRSTTRQAIPSARQPGGCAQAHPQPVPEGHASVRSVAGPVDGWPGRAAPGRACRLLRQIAGRHGGRQYGWLGGSQPVVVTGLVQVPFVVQGNRLDEDADAAVSRGAMARQVRSIAAASSGLAGQRDDQAGDITQRGDQRCRCENGRRIPAGKPARRSARPSGCGTARGRRREAWRPRRVSGQRHCAGRPGTGSPAPGSRPARPAPSATPRMDCSSSTVSNTRPAPNRPSRPLVAP